MKQINLLMLAAILTLCGTANVWADATVSTEAGLRTAVGSSQAVTLDADIVLSNGRLVVSGQTVTLNLNGHTLIRSLQAADQDGQVIFLGSGGKLTIADKSDNSGRISGGWAYQGGGIYVSEGCELVVSGGTITGNRADQIAEGGYGYGGGVENHGIMTMTGGTISSNTAGLHGGGIYQAGTLNIQGNPVIDDLFLSSYSLITLTGALTTGASIGLDAQEVRQTNFTVNYKTYHDGTAPDAYFHSNNTFYAICLNADGEVKYGVKYIERAWDDDTKQVTETPEVCGSYTPINSTDTSDEGWVALYDGWYVVTGNSAYSVLNVTGTDVHLVIPDGISLDVTHVKVEEGHTLNIYGQTNDSGTLTASNRNHYSGAAAIGGGNKTKAGTIVIHGGKITANNNIPDHYPCGAGIGSGAECGNDAGYTVTVTVYGGSVEAKGGFAAAGIGGGIYSKGGWLTLYGGTVTASGGYGYDYCAAGIGGGDSGNGGLTYVYGGKLTAYGHLNAPGIGCGGSVFGESDRGGATYIYGGSVEADGGGRAIDGSWFGTLEIDNSLMVSAKNDYGSPYEKFSAAERVAACQNHFIAFIEPCDHAGATYTINGTGDEGTHLKHCAYCYTAFTAEKHTISGGKCTVCGVASDVCKVTVYVPVADTQTDGDYDEPMAYYMVKDETFQLPPAPNTPDGMEFAGWVEGDNVSRTSFITDGSETLLEEESEYTITSDVTLTARFRAINISLADDADNSETLFKNHGKTANSVTLEGRTLYKDGTWNTLCLPFGLSNFADTPLEGATVKKLSTTSFADGTLTLNFSEDLTAIDAGKPYIVKWTKPDGYVAYNGSNASTCSDIVSPVFSGVTVKSTTTYISTYWVGFTGSFSPTVISGENKTMLYLGADNKLYHPNAAMTIGACRAYFELKNGLMAGTPAGVRAFELNFGDESTGIVDVDLKSTSQESGISNPLQRDWYDMQGRRLSGQPARKGMYIYKGKKIIIQ